MRMAVQPARQVSYSPSLTLVLTRACANRCLYCGFRRETDGLISWAQVERLIRQARQQGVSEILVMAGERAHRRPQVRKALAVQGYESMADFCRAVCERLLAARLLPHVNIGLLSYEEMQDLRKVTASMGLMMEGDYGELGDRVHPGKDFARRLQNLAWAGELRIPFTTGLLLGLGESQDQRLASLKSIAACTSAQGQVQEVILQPFGANQGSRWPARPVALDDLAALAGCCRQEMPGVHVQIPPNLYPRWPELIDSGFDDLGGISKERDAVNHSYPWPALADIRAALQERGYGLAPRLPLYPEFFRRGWYGPLLRPVLQHWIDKHDGYQHYN